MPPSSHLSKWLILVIAALFYSVNGYNSSKHSTLYARSSCVFTSSSFVWKFSWTEVVYCVMCMWTTGINFHNFPTHDVFFIHVSAAGPKDAGETRQNVTYASFFDRNVSFPCSFCPSHKSMILKQNPLHKWCFQSQLEWICSI